MCCCRVLGKIRMCCWYIYRKCCDRHAYTSVEDWSHEVSRYTLLMVISLSILLYSRELSVVNAVAL